MAGTACGQSRRGFSLLEVAVSLAIVAVLLAVLIPTLRHARSVAQRDACAANQRTIGQAWTLYLSEHEEFPTVAWQPGWHWGGVRFSPATGQPHIEIERPINQYLPLRKFDGSPARVFQCPGDCGITHPHAAAAGTGPHTAYQAFGTSYRANAMLLANQSSPDDFVRGLRVAEIFNASESVVIMGDAVWFEVVHDTGRDADWHGKPDAGNMLFMDGSVKFMTIDMDSKRIDAMFRPALGE